MQLRSRTAGARAPAPFIFVGKPSLWGNPFERDGIGQARSVILYRAWLVGELTPGVLRCAHFSFDEAIALDRWRDRVLARLGDLLGVPLRCTCRRGSVWCHALVLASLVGEAPGASAPGVPNPGLTAGLRTPVNRTTSTGG